MLKSTATSRGNTNSIGGGGTNNNNDIETPSAELPPHLAVGASVRSSLRHSSASNTKKAANGGSINGISTSVTKRRLSSNQSLLLGMIVGVSITYSLHALVTSMTFRGSESTLYDPDRPSIHFSIWPFGGRGGSGGTRSHKALFMLSNLRQSRIYHATRGRPLDQLDVPRSGDQGSDSPAKDNAEPVEITDDMLLKNLREAKLKGPPAANGANLRFRPANPQLPARGQPLPRANIRLVSQANELHDSIGALKTRFRRPMRRPGG